MYLGENNRVLSLLRAPPVCFIMYEQDRAASFFILFMRSGPCVLALVFIGAVKALQKPQ